MTASFSELEFHQKLRENNQQFFLKMVASYEKTIAASMRAQGFKRINQKERTVTFSFGTMTFSRSRWKKGDIIITTSLTDGIDKSIQAGAKVVIVCCKKEDFISPRVTSECAIMLVRHSFVKCISLC